MAMEFEMGKAKPQQTLEKLARILDADGIPYAVVGALALFEYGYRRVTVDVDLLLSASDLARFKESHLGRGYAERFSGGRGVIDTETRVSIDFLIAGDYPGDGLPKAVRFPDPSRLPQRRGGISIVPLPILIDLKIASGLSAPHRLKDLADVLELIRATGLPRELAQQLDPSVRAKYDELWQAAQTPDPF